jgi:uncharacterized protein
MKRTKAADMAPHHRTCKAAVAALMLAVSFAGSVAAGAPEDGVAAYEKGDYATALRLLCPLADQGDAGAQYNLGLMYANVQGVPQDYAAAVNWYRKGAEQGDTGAQVNLGLMYDNGQGVQQDYATAMSWYRKAAERGDAAAKYFLAVMYEYGRGVPQDYVTAHMWFNLAAASGDTDAVIRREMVAAKMTPAQIAEAEKLAREWKPK